MEKKITVNGKEYNMRATALIPRQYRNRFGRDLIVDMKKLQEGLTKAGKGAEFDAIDLTIFENSRERVQPTGIDQAVVP